MDLSQTMTGIPGHCPWWTGSSVDILLVNQEPGTNAGSASKDGLTLRQEAPPGFPLRFEVQAEDITQMTSWSDGPGDRSLWVLAAWPGLTPAHILCGVGRLLSVCPAQVEVLFLRVWLTPAFQPHRLAGGNDFNTTTKTGSCDGNFPRSQGFPTANLSCKLPEGRKCVLFFSSAPRFFLESNMGPGRGGTRHLLRAV